VSEDTELPATIRGEKSATCRGNVEDSEGTTT
jgi:hypothetical protein